ncbi:hypothetical protein SLE2022_312650 [Rubroshorea leprosula]
MAESSIDKISRLTDELLLHILSFLSMRDVVRTSVLSTRWRYLYVSVSNLDLDFHVGAQMKANKFCLRRFVDRLFFFRNRSSVHKFHLKCSTSISGFLDPLPLKEWISSLIWHGIRELDLFIELSDDKELLLPTSFFTCESGLKVPSKVCLPSLKVLRLCICNPTPKRLRMDHCKLGISNPTLKRLHIEHRPKGRSHSLEIVINAPSLVDLDYSISCLTSHACVNIQSLDEARIDFQQGGGNPSNYIEAATDLLRGICNIQKLGISGRALAHFDGRNWSPAAWYQLEESRASCLSASLKTIEMLNFDGNEHEMEFVKYLLKNARVLESMKIHILGKYKKQVLEITKELLSLPRVSKKCNVVVV